MTSKFIRIAARRPSVLRSQSLMLSVHWLNTKAIVAVMAHRSLRDLLLTVNLCSVIKISLGSSEKF